jgi:hypothetical protein
LAIIPSTIFSINPTRHHFFTHKFLSPIKQKQHKVFFFEKSVPKLFTMMKITSLLVALVAVQGFNVEPTGRRGFFTKSVEAMTGAAFFVAATQPANAGEKLSCDAELGPFELPSIAACHGEGKDMSPSEEAYADFLMSKMGVSPNSVLDDKSKNKRTVHDRKMLKTHE